MGLLAAPDPFGQDAADFPVDVFPTAAPDDCCDECWEQSATPQCPWCDDPRRAIDPLALRRILRAGRFPVRQVRLLLPAGHCNPCHIYAVAPARALPVLRACRAVLLAISGLVVLSGRSSLDGTPYLRVRRADNDPGPKLPVDGAGTMATEYPVTVWDAATVSPAMQALITETVAAETTAAPAFAAAGL